MNKNLWAPWRIDYILGPKAGSCVFCLNKDTTDDCERQILYRGKHSFVIMNKYPYCNGHIMVAPYAHVADITDLAADELADLMQLVQKSALILRAHLKCQGMNIGMNIGEAAGAGVREHLHCHLVPRWNGDSNFMASLGGLRTIPQHLTETYKALLPLFQALKTS
ncbi:HIT domain-containing protein [Desulfovibrio sp. OttesenSCG-928-F07]|nr:HIT domain-containing protein [Desulfovibrio sp. OttesenSCG-928-F07]